jgi:flagellar motor switch protein FliG
MTGGGAKLELEAATPILFNMATAATGAIEVFLGEPEKQPYNFINEKDIVNILLLMKEEPPLHLAVIAYYLRPDLSAALISGLDAAVRKQVVDHLAAPQMLMRDEVKSLGQTLKTRVRGIIYGVDQYFAIYDSAAPAAQGELLKALEAQTPALVEKMRNEMFSFDDLMALEASALRVVFREVALRSLATALTGASAPMRDKVLNVLPSGASEIIRQEIEMNPVHSQKTIDEERKKIVAVVRRLVWDKKITMPPRQRGSRAAPASAAPPAPAVKA